MTKSIHRLGRPLARVVHGCMGHGVTTPSLGVDRNAAATRFDRPHLISTTDNDRTHVPDAKHASSRRCVCRFASVDAAFKAPNGSLQVSVTVGAKSLHVRVRLQPIPLLLLARPRSTVAWCTLDMKPFSSTSRSNPSPSSHDPLHTPSIDVAAQAFGVDGPPLRRPNRSLDRSIDWLEPRRAMEQIVCTPAAAPAPLF